MALKTGEKPSVDPPVPSDTVLLELALYTHYTWGGVTYERGTAYRFKKEDAVSLMSEQDHGRPLWRQFRPPKPKGTPSMPIVDSTEVKAARSRLSLEEAALRSPGTNTGKRIEVGTDEEIQDILSRPEVDTSGDVTV